MMQMELEVRSGGPFFIYSVLGPTRHSHWRGGWMVGAVGLERAGAPVRRSLRALENLGIRGHDSRSSLSNQGLESSWRIIFFGLDKKS